MYMVPVHCSSFTEVYMSEGGLVYVCTYSMYSSSLWCLVVCTYVRVYICMHVLVCSAKGRANVEQVSLALLLLL